MNQQTALIGGEHRGVEIGLDLVAQDEGQHGAQVLQGNITVAPEEGHGLGVGDDGVHGPHTHTGQGLVGQIGQTVPARGAAQEPGHITTCQASRVLAAVFQLSGCVLADLELGGEEGEATEHRLGHAHGLDLSGDGVMLGRGEDHLGRDMPLRVEVSLPALNEPGQKTRIEGQRRYGDVDTVPQRLDHLVGAASSIVIGGEIPGGITGLVELVVNLDVAIGQDRQKRGLRTGGDAVVLVDDLDAHSQPGAPRHIDVRKRLGPHEITRQWCSEHIRHRQLRVAVLHTATHLLNRVTGEHSHENGGGGLAAPGSSDEQAAAAHCEGEQRHQHEGGV